MFKPLSLGDRKLIHTSKDPDVALERLVNIPCLPVALVEHLSYA